jgi:hypothetical protein
MEEIIIGSLEKRAAISEDLSPPLRIAAVRLPTDSHPPTHDQCSISSV